MKILLINKFHYIQGGADRHYLELADILKAHGHEVIFFSMQGSNNIECEQSKYFVNHLDFSKVKLDKDLFKKIGRMFWSRQAQSKLQQLIDNEKPDIAHLHNIYHQLSPSIIKTLKKNNIPVVMTVHDYYLVSPLYSLFAKGKVFDPDRLKYWQIIINRAVKNSLAASVLSSTVNWWHKFRKHYSKIDLFICPSQFLANYLEKVYPDANITVLPNFVKELDNASGNTGDYYIYAGRIIDEKGVDLILKAAKRLPNINFRIAGIGPDEYKLKKEFSLENVKWLGQLNSQKLQKEIGKAKAMIAPSRWYENCPLSILESFSLGVPVIASNMGGIPEIVKDKENGLIFENDNPADLVEQLKLLDKNEDLRKTLAHNSKIAANNYSTENYYNKLYSLYESL